MRHLTMLNVRTAAFAAGLILFVFAACGGGGGKKSGGNVGVTPNTRTATATKSPRPGDPTFTPPATEVGTPPSPTPTPIEVPIGGDIGAAVRNAEAGAVIFIPGGAYAPFVLNSSNVKGAITLIGDTTGRATGSSGTPVVINAGNGAAGITVQGVTDIVLDGFTISGGTVAGIEVRDSTGVTIRNSVVRDSQRDGIRFVRAASSLVFNNLIYDNTGAGVSAIGTTDLSIVNNTFYHNGDPGILVGDELLPSDTIFARNNILVGNSPRGIIIDPTTGGYDGDYNLNTDGYGNETAVGANDIHVDPLFNNPGSDEGFKLPPTDDDCNGGGPAHDAGDPATDSALLETLSMRSTQVDGRFDCIGSGCCPEGCGASNPTPLPCVHIGSVDLGFHYISARSLFTPTATPRATRTPRTPGSVATATSGPPQSPVATSSLPSATPTTGTDRPTRTPVPTRTLEPTRTPR